MFERKGATPLCHRNCHFNHLRLSFSTKKKEREREREIKNSKEEIRRKRGEAVRYRKIINEKI